jgi:hypothetical protein
MQSDLEFVLSLQRENLAGVPVGQGWSGFAVGRSRAVEGRT